MEDTDHHICLNIRKMKIKKVKLFVNDNLKSNKVAREVKEKLEKNKFSIVDEGYDLAIAIGGDGSFLRMVKNANFNNKCCYVGINAGTLGFAQEVSALEIDQFIDTLKRGDFKVEDIGVCDVVIKTKKKEIRHCSMNEIVVRDEALNTAEFEVYVQDSLLEDFVGDGLLISTSFGSTAYNLSFGGSIVFNTFHTLQITPVAPLNSKVYKSLSNSLIIPDNMVIRLVPKRNNGNVIITIDGDNNFYEGVERIETVINKTVKVIRLKDYNFIRKVNDKFLN